VPTIAQVELRELLGSGAFGVVFRGHHRVLDAPVAVKVLASTSTNSAHAVESLLREARVMARVDHPNVLRVFDAGVADGQFYLVLEFMDGGSLEGARLSLEALVSAGRQLLSGLQALHEVGVIHRDIKPANVLVRRADGRLKLADLGIAMDTAARTSGSIVGTLSYMAPELLFEQPPQYGPRSDLYALGITLAELATGASLCPSSDFASMLHWVREGARPDLRRARPDLPSSIVSLIQRLIDPAPNRRPSSAAEVLAEWPTEEDLRATPSVRSEEMTERGEAVPGRRIGPWIVGEEHHRTDSWRYYAVTHRKTGASARLAQLDPEFFFARARARRDAWAEILTAGVALAWNVSHENLLPSLDWGWSGKLPFFVYPAAGRTVLGLVHSGGPFDERTAVEVGIALCDAVTALHDAGIVHQMVRPDTVLVRSDGKGWVLGWPVHCVRAGSLDKHATGLDLRPLALEGVAPEAYSGAPTIEPAVDSYGIGLVLYWLLAGRHPEDGATLAERLQARARGHVPLRSVASDVTAPTCVLVDALLSTDPAQRPTARRAGERLRRVAQGLEVIGQGLSR
jgi:serine/threonine protein kinase